MNRKNRRNGWRYKQVRRCHDCKHYTYLPPDDWSIYPDMYCNLVFDKPIIRKLQDIAFENSTPDTVYINSIKAAVKCPYFHYNN
jgi:hypothetical protein